MPALKTFVLGIPSGSNLRQRQGIVYANDWERSPAAIMRHANARSNRDTLIEQRTKGGRALTVPLENLDSD